MFTKSKHEPVVLVKFCDLTEHDTTIVPAAVSGLLGATVGVPVASGDQESMFVLLLDLVAASPGRYAPGSGHRLVVRAVA